GGESGLGPGWQLPRLVIKEGRKRSIYINQITGHHVGSGAQAPHNLLRLASEGCGLPALNGSLVLGGRLVQVGADSPGEVAEGRPRGHSRAVPPSGAQTAAAWRARSRQACRSPGLAAWAVACSRRLTTSCASPASSAAASASSSPAS